MNDVESNREVFYIKADNRERKLTQTVRIIQNIGTAPSTMTANSLFLEAPSWTPRTQFILTHYRSLKTLLDIKTYF